MRTPCFGLIAREIFSIATQFQREFAWMDESDERLRALVMSLFLRTLCWAAFISNYILFAWASGRNISVFVYKGFNFGTIERIVNRLGVHAVRDA